MQFTLIQAIFAAIAFASFAVCLVARIRARSVKESPLEKLATPSALLAAKVMSWALLVMLGAVIVLVVATGTKLSAPFIVTWGLFFAWVFSFSPSVSDGAKQHRMVASGEAKSVMLRQIIALHVNMHPGKALKITAQPDGADAEDSDLVSGVVTIDTGKGRVRLKSKNLPSLMNYLALLGTPERGSPWFAEVVVRAPQEGIITRAAFKASSLTD